MVPGAQGPFSSGIYHLEGRAYSVFHVQGKRPEGEDIKGRVRASCPLKKALEAALNSFVHILLTKT